jgi:hypothetical protein
VFATELTIAALVVAAIAAVNMVRTVGYRSARYVLLLQTCSTSRIESLTIATLFWRRHLMTRFPLIWLIFGFSFRRSLAELQEARLATWQEVTDEFDPSPLGRYRMFGPIQENLRTTNYRNCCVLRWCGRDGAKDADIVIFLGHGLAYTAEDLAAARTRAESFLDSL